MAIGHQMTEQLAGASERLAPRIALVLPPALLALALAGLTWPGRLAEMFAVAGIALIGLYSAITVFAGWRQTRERQAWQALDKLIEDDPQPVFASDRDGAIRHRNPAASERFGNGHRTVSALLAERFADAAGVVRRLQARALREGSAEEVTATGSPAHRIVVHRVDEGFLWRLYAMSGASGRGLSEDPAMPILTVTRANSITGMNAAMQALLGGRPATLDRVVSDLPLRDGQVHKVQTPTGKRELRVAVIETGEGQRQVYFWPAAVPEARWSQFDALPVPMVKLSPDGAIQMANLRARELLQLQPGPPPEFAEVVEGLGRPVDEWLRDVAEGRSAGRPEVVRATHSEEDLFLQVALGRVAEGGEVSLLAVLIDATELKTLEAQFVQSQKMQAIGQLAGGVAHDFNNLLTAISGHCDLLLLRHDPADPDYGDLMQINQNANRAASLVGQLLAFSRKQNMQPELIDLRDTVGDLTHLLNRLVGEKIELSFQHDDELPHVRADKRQLEQVLMNLVVNARDAMPEGGQITIDTREVRLAEPLKRDRASVPRGDYVAVTVEDQGCGIPKEKLPKIFEPFYSTKRLGEGTGLGLSMAYGIVKQSGGYIFADSVVGQGTSFRIYLPAHRGRALTSVGDVPAEPKPVPKQEGGVVLLVEDEAPVRAFASRALRLRGYTVLEAESAEEALKTLEDRGLEIDVFVTDVVMPGMDGPSWVSQALQERPETRVIFVSGYAEDSFSSQRAKIPNSVFLPKPFSLSELTETVQAQIH